MILRRRRMLGTAMGVAATASMISGTRRNMAQRRAYDQQADAMEQANQAAQAAPTALPVDPTAQLAQEIKQLNDMKLAGLLTEEEYKRKKEQLLNI